MARRLQLLSSPGHTPRDLVAESAGYLLRRKSNLAIRLRQYHAALGALALVAFVLSGQHMHWDLGHLREMPDVPRLMYRSAHIYLLFAGLLNVALGLYLQAQDSPRGRWAQLIGSVMLMASPVFFGWSFWVESQQASIERHLLRLGIYLSFGGVILHALAGLRFWKRGM